MGGVVGGHGLPEEHGFLSEGGELSVGSREGHGRTHSSPRLCGKLGWEGEQRPLEALGEAGFSFH